MQKLHCEHCGKKIATRKCIGSKHPKYCSNKCKGESMRKVHEVECVVCGKKFRFTHYSPIYIRTCSEKCNNIYKKCRTEYKRYRKAIEYKTSKDYCFE